MHILYNDLDILAMTNFMFSILIYFRGRGVWRCLYDPTSNLLITAGFDSSIKVHRLNNSLSGTSNEPAESADHSMKREVFTSCIPNSLDHNGHMDR